MVLGYSDQSNWERKNRMRPDPAGNDIFENEISGSVRQKSWMSHLLSTIFHLLKYTLDFHMPSDIGPYRK